METEQAVKERWQADANNIALDLEFKKHHYKYSNTQKQPVEKTYIEIRGIITLPNGKRFGKRIGYEEVSA
jgi:hypothetical protein